MPMNDLREAMMAEDLLVTTETEDVRTADLSRAAEDVHLRSAAKRKAMAD